VKRGRLERDTGWNTDGGGTTVVDGLDVFLERHENLRLVDSGEIER
jgi:hypothetical protein